MSDKYRDDIALVTAVSAGEPGAWQKLMIRHQADIHYALLRALIHRGHDPTDETLEDLESDLILNLAADHFRRLRSYRGQCSLRHWLKVVAGHFSIDFLRKQRDLVPLPTGEDATFAEALIDPAPSPPEQLERQQQAEALVELFAQLNDEDRLFVELYYRRELPSERVAELMGTTVGAIYARKNRLRKRLKKLAERAALL